MKDTHGFVLGGMDMVHCQEYELQLNPGDELYFYTDGVVEAMNANNELFGSARMLMALNAEPGLHPENCSPAVKKHIDTVVGDGLQFDSLTTLLC